MAEANRKSRLVPGLIAFLILSIWAGVYYNHVVRREAAVGRRLEFQARLAAAVARSAEAWIKIRVMEQKMPIAEAEQEVAERLVAPLRISGEGDAWIYNRKYAILNTSGLFPSDYRGRPVRELFERQPGAEHFHDMVNGVMDAGQGAGWHVWSPGRGREWAAWSSLRLGRESWTVGLSIQEKTLLEQAGVGRPAWGVLGAATAATVMLILICVIMVRQTRRMEEEIRNRAVLLERADADLDRERAERRLVADALREAKEVAESASQAKSEFIANTSHELRTPLNGILGYTQILKRDPTLTDMQQKRIEIIHRSGEHLLMIINDILDLSKIEQRKMDLQLRDYSLKKLLDSVVDMVGVQAGKKEIEFQTDFDPELPEIVHGDEIRLRQVLLNLLGNAAKFTAAGGVYFNVTVVSALRSVAGAGGRCTLRFEVRDTGIGIPEDNLSALFQPFRQFAGHRVENEGTGLGLAISSRLTDMMGSRLRVESREGAGSRFWFELDLPVVAFSERPEPMALEMLHLNDTIDESVWTPPPPAELTALFEMAMRGDINGLKRRAEKLASTPGYALFGQKIYYYAKSLMIDELQEFIGKFMEVEK